MAIRESIEEGQSELVTDKKEKTRLTLLLPDTEVG